MVQAKRRDLGGPREEGGEPITSLTLPYTSWRALVSARSVTLPTTHYTNNNYSPPLQRARRGPFVLTQMQ